MIKGFANTTGATSITTIKTGDPMVKLVLGLFVNVTLNAGMVVTGTVNESSERAMRHTIRASILATVVNNFLMVVPNRVFTIRVLSIVDVPRSMLPCTILCLHVCLLNLPMVLLCGFLSTIFEDINSAGAPLVILTLSKYLGILLGLFFMVILGVAMGKITVTAIVSGTVDSVILFVILVGSSGCVGLSLERLHVSGEMLNRVLRVNLPTNVRDTIFTVSGVVVRTTVGDLKAVIVTTSDTTFGVRMVTCSIFGSFDRTYAAFINRGCNTNGLSHYGGALLLSVTRSAVTATIAVKLILFSKQFLLSVFADSPRMVRLNCAELLLVFSTCAFSVLCRVVSKCLHNFNVSLMPTLLAAVNIYNAEMF